MTAADLSACDELRSLAGWNQTIADWQQFLATQPDGCFVIEERGHVLGCVTTICYGSTLAWIGMMLVHPDERRRGIGRVLMKRCLAYLDGCGIKCMKLDATPAGQPLYEQLGFASEWTLTRWSRSKRGGLFSKSNSPCRDCTPNDLERVIALDATAFGVRREELLRALVAHSERVLVAEAGGQVIGAGLLRSGARANYLGPVVADSPETAASLIGELLSVSASENVFWDIPDANAAAIELAVAHGFERARTLTRMARGEPRVIHQTQHIFAIADPALG